MNKNRAVSWWWSMGAGSSITYHHEACIGKKHPNLGKRLARVETYTNIPSENTREQLRVIRYKIIGFYCDTCGERLETSEQND